MSTPRLAGLSAEPDQALPQMPPEHEAHLRRLNEWVCARVDRKYRRGQAEHGGRLWEAPGLLAELQAETIDQLAYGQALEEHVARIFQDYDAGRATADDALARMRALLWGRSPDAEADGQGRQELSSPENTRRRSETGVLKGNSRG